MNRRILTLCKYLVATSILFATAPAFSGVNDHPAFKFKSNKDLANLKPISKSQTSLSRVDQKPSVDELHYEEKHPHQDAILVDTASIDTSKLIPSKVLSLDPNRPDLELPDHKSPSPAKPISSLWWNLSSILKKRCAMSRRR